MGLVQFAEWPQYMYARRWVYLYSTVVQNSTVPPATRTLAALRPRPSPLFPPRCLASPRPAPPLCLRFYFSARRRAPPRIRKAGADEDTRAGMSSPAAHPAAGKKGKKRKRQRGGEGAAAAGRPPAGKATAGGAGAGAASKAERQKKAKSAIGDLFAAGKKKQEDEAARERREAEEQAAAQPRSAPPDSEDSEDDGDARFNPRKQPDPPVHRVDAESGLPVYKAHLLKLSYFGEYKDKGGGTELCPFDCNCCF